MFSEIEVKETHVEVSIHAGQSISDASVDMAKKANYFKMPVLANFNGIPVKAEPGAEDDSVAIQYYSVINQQKADYENSEQYKIDQAKAEERKVKKYALSLEYMEQLREKDFNMDRTIEWLSKYCKLSNEFNCSNTFEEVIQLLESKGYKRNEYVGDKDLAKNKNKFGKYIIGQALDCLYRNLPVHQVLLKFAQDYKVFKI